VRNIPTSFSNNFTVIEEFEFGNGKFADGLGNTAVIDCNYANKIIRNTYLEFFANLISTQPAFFIFLQGIDASAK
jgi:hypothetical protein